MKLKYLLLLGTIFLLTGCFDKSDIALVDGLKVSHNNKVEVLLKGKSGNLNKELVVRNTSKNDITYQIVWDNVINTYIAQNDLRYSITADGEGSKSIGESQLPVTSFVIIDNITIPAGKTHTYKINAKNIGDGKNETANSEFKGNLIVKVQ